MLRKIFFIVFIMLLTASFSLSVSALGIGGYVDLGIGNTSGNRAIPGSGTDLIPTGGVMIDTAAAKNKIFNYRFKFGGGRMLTNGLKLDKVGMVHTFGLSPSNLRGDEARFFFGPRIGIFYCGGEFTDNNLNARRLFFFPWNYYNTKKIRLDIVRFDLGLVLLGFNFNLGKFTTLTFEFGMNYGVMLGEQDGNNVTFTGYEGFSAIGCMYRINDSYKEDPVPDDKKIQTQD